MRSGDVAEGTCGGRDGMRGVSGKGGTRASPTTAAWGRCALSWGTAGMGEGPRGAGAHRHCGRGLRRHPVFTAR